MLERVNSYFNCDFTFEKCDKVYVGRTCDELETRLTQHVTDKNSQVYKYRQNKAKISLIVEAPSKNKKLLEHVENKWIHDYAKEYTDRLLNIKSNPVKQKEVKFKVEMETDKQYC